MPRHETKFYCECGNDMRIVGRNERMVSYAKYCKVCEDMPPPAELGIGMDSNSMQRDRDVPLAGTAGASLASTWSTFYG